MEKQVFEHICTLSKLDYDEREAEKAMAQMSDIIALMDTVKEYDITYDDTKDHNEIAFCDVREDKAEPSFPAERLQQNTQPRDNCYVVPKMIE